MTDIIEQLQATKASLATTDQIRAALDAAASDIRRLRILANQKTLECAELRIALKRRHAWPPTA